MRLSYLEDGDVWVAAADGSSATRLTTGGGHVSPSQSDDGTIAVAKGDTAVRKLGRKSRALTLVVTAGSATQTVVVAPR